MRACHVVSVTSDSVTLGTIWQAPLSMGFSRQKHCSALLCPPPGDHPGPRTEPASLMSTPLAGGFFTTSATREDPGGKNLHIPREKRGPKRCTQCSLQHCSQQPRHGNRLNAHRERNGQRGCGTCIYKGTLLGH